MFNKKYLTFNIKVIVTFNIKVIVTFFLIAYFAPDVIGEPLTNRKIPYIKIFGICPSPSGGGGDRTHDLWVTRHDHYHVVAFNIKVIVTFVSQT